MLPYPTLPREETMNPIRPQGGFRLPLQPATYDHSEPLTACAKDTHIQPYNALALPYLIFSDKLQLTSLNQIAQSVLDVSTECNGDWPDAAWFFAENGVNKNTGVEQSRMGDLMKVKKMFQESSDRSSMDPWYQGVAISYWTGVGDGRKLHRGEAIIQSFLPSSPLDSSSTTPTTRDLRAPPPDASDPLDDSAPSPDHHHFSVLLLREIFTSVTSPSTSLFNLVEPLRSMVPPPPIPISVPEALSNIKPTLDDVAAQLVPHFQKKTTCNEEDYKDYKEIVDLMPQICFTTDVLGAVTYFNKYWSATITSGFFCK